jgi:hypothetical protein
MSMEYEDRIRAALDARARRVAVDPDPTDLADRVSRRERKRSGALAVALVLALFAGPTLGFVVGRGEDEPRGTAAERDGDDSVTIDESDDLPTLRSEDAGGATFAQATDGFSSGSARESAMLSFGGTQRLARAFVRETGNTKIRVFHAAMETPTDAGPPWWTPPAWCFPNRYVQADVSDDDMVGFGYGYAYAELRDGQVVAGSMTLAGQAEQAPTWIVVAQAVGGAARVRATFPGGTTDEMEPVDGIAVLVGRVASDPGDDWYAQSAQLEAFDAGGTPLGTTTTSSEVFGWGDSEAMAACTAPQELPPPGAEQPPDVTAARQAVIDSFLRARGANDETQEQMMSAIDDPTGFPELWNQLASGPFKEQVDAAVIGVDDVVFQSATRAAVKYHWDVPGYGSSFHNRFGEVVLVEGAWKVTRDTMCRDFSLAGVTCD